MDNTEFWRALEAEAVLPDDPRCPCGILLRSTQSPLCDLCFAEFERTGHAA